MTAVPILDLTRAHQRIAPELERRWQQLIGRTAFVLGPEVREFEEAFARFLEVPKTVGVANGTDALILALRALGLAPGDEVLVPAFTFFATAEAVALAGGTPVLCDIEETTFNLDPADAAARVTPRTVGILGVHLYGRPFDFQALGALAGRHGLWILEDAAQAHGARWQGWRVGGLGDLAAWSFYPTKNLGCYGDGGAVSGRDPALVERVFLHANHGQTSRYHHTLVGTNSRLDSLQAAVLNCRLPLLDSDNAARRGHAARYRERLAGVGDLVWPVDRPGDEPVFHQVAVRSAHRDALMAHVQAAGVGCSVHYPAPVHHQPAMAELVPAGLDLPVATRAATEVLCLPIFAELTGEEVDRTCEAIAEFFARRA